MIDFEPALELKIPDRISLRQEICKKVDDYISGHLTLPPVTLDKLSEFAGMLMRENEWEEAHRGFVMLLCGNAVWRRVVETVEFRRRVLLLPQCLKNSHACQGKMDNIGLLCNDCGSCSIPAIVHEAENLGYVVLITEGTTITTRLIESGKVDAVIGVGCMEVLQKMFRLVSKFAVPGIGIPLMTCGCKDTTADLAWIRQELYRFRKDSSIRLLNLNHIRNKTASLFGEEQLHKFLAPEQNATIKIVIDSLLAGGQRIRPFIATLTYEAFCTQSDEMILNRLALSVECFHKASLIHDDIEDDDPLRYGRQTIHTQHGIAIAINAGDLLIGEGYRLIAEIGLPPDLISECFRVISTGHRAMALGQGAELLATAGRKILTLTEILEIFENKTSSAFRVSLLLGGMIGGADMETLKKLEWFSHFTGIAYQIMDDMEDYDGQRDDIRFRKPSIHLALLMKLLREDDRAIIEQALIAGNFNLIYLYLKNHQINDRCVCLLKENLDSAKESLENLGNIGLKLALHEILGKVFDKYL